MNTPFKILIVLFLAACSPSAKVHEIPLLKISENKRFLSNINGNPFFWLGDTGWLLFKKLDRKQVELYLEDRKQKGFNVIQAMVIHDIRDATNAYGDSAILNQNVAELNITEGSDPTDEEQYDFWDHVDYIVNLAEEKGIYMGMLPMWGSNIDRVSLEEAKVYAAFLAERYKDYSNIIWLNGGDKRGNENADKWNVIGNTINQIDTIHLITFHPFGRTMSSDWFHNEPWLDFNMFQSGHRSYEQDDTDRGYGPDNWRYVLEDYSKVPVKPTIDGEPSYEHIPIGLHDRGQDKWTENDARRYVYWSVFAGAFGHTYGHGSVMQFFEPDSAGAKGAYGVTMSWKEALDSSGDGKLIHLKNLMLSKSYFDRVPDQSLIADGQGEKYDFIIATRGEKYALIYTYSGKSFSVNGENLNSREIIASWFNPRTGEITDIGKLVNCSNIPFDPPGEPLEGNDWVLVLESV